MHISKVGAEAEALRIATAFFTANVPLDSPFFGEIHVSPATYAPGYKRRKTIIKWNGWLFPKEDCGYDVTGGSIEVNIETQEVKWSDY